MGKTFKISTLFVLMISLTVLFGQGISRADTILFQDNFNAENGGAGALNYNSFTNWAVTDGTVDLIGNGYYDFHPGNGLYVDLDGSTSNAGILTSKNSFTFLPNVMYRLSFDLGRSQPYGGNNLVTVQVSLANVVYTVTNNDPLLTYTLDFISFLNSYTTPIVFSNAGGDNIGAVLDNVRLSQVSDVQEAPEPSTMLLLGSGLIGLAGYGRRKFFKK